MCGLSEREEIDEVVEGERALFIVSKGGYGCRLQMGHVAVEEAIDEDESFFVVGVVAHLNECYIVKVKMSFCGW